MGEKILKFKDYLGNRDVLKKANLQTKPNSDDQQQHIGNKRTEYNPLTNKLTDYSDNEIDDLLEDGEK